MAKESKQKQQPVTKKKDSSGKGSGDRLIYPMTTPRGPSTSDGAISRGHRFETKQIDYMKLMIYDPETANPYNYVGQNSRKGNPGRRYNRNQIYKTIYLYLPHDLNETYSTSYEKAALGPFGDIAVEAMRSGDTSKVAEKISSAAGSAKPEVAFNAVANIFNGAAGAFGVDGNMSKNSLAALSSGKVFNPYEETTFKGVNYRSHSFTFDMAPRNPQEARNIQAIIHELRDSMLPGTSGDDSRWLTIPRFFRAEIVRYSPRRSGSDALGEEKLNEPAMMRTLLTFPVNMVLTNMQVNLTPNGQNTSLRADLSGIDYGPAQYRMTLSFDETAFITRDVYNPNNQKTRKKIAAPAADNPQGKSKGGSKSSKDITDAAKQAGNP